MTLIALALSAAISLAWAFAPLRSVELPTPSPPADAPAAPMPEKAAIEVDLAAFSAQLSKPLPPAPEPERPAAPVPPPPVRLVAIISSGEEMLAALYDAEIDRLVFVSEGDSMSRYTVEHIDRGAVTLSAGEQSYELALSPAPPLSLNLPRADP